jgi:hypothetical protein
MIGPLMGRAGREALRGALPLAVFFACIGLGFMLVEISQMQRLIVFLGHPIYGLTVVLFSLLLASGAGSFMTGSVGREGLTRSAAPRLLGLLVTLIAFGTAVPYAIDLFRASTTPVRVVLAVAILAPIGVSMGMAFPLGMKLAAARAPAAGPWLWGINGATSVCGSVLAVAVALNSSISAAFWSGVGFYAVAVLAFVWAVKRQPAEGGPSR